MHLKTASGWQINHYAKIRFHHHLCCPLRLPCCLSTKPPLTSAGMSRDFVMTVTMTSISTFVTKTITLSINIRINNHDKDIFWGIWCRLQIVVELLHDHHSFHTWCSCHGMSMVTMVMAMIATTIRWWWRHIATHSLVVLMGPLLQISITHWTLSVPGLWTVSRSSSSSSSS